MNYCREAKLALTCCILAVTAGRKFLEGFYINFKSTRESFKLETNFATLYNQRNEVIFAFNWRI